MRATSASLLRFLALLLLASPAAAQDAPVPINVSIAARMAFERTDTDGSPAADQFFLDSARLFVNGAVTKDVKFALNTEFDSRTNNIQLMDAIGRFEFSPGFNVWVGRFIPPSDRSNLYGPFYGNHWGIYLDGVQDGYPFITEGRANGAAYWGQYGKLSLSGGVFDGASATGRPTLIKAGRAEMNFWDAEQGYYRSGTYYGEKNILSLGVAGQVQASDETAANVDFLLERKVGTGGAFTLEAELARYDRLGGYDARYATNAGGYVLAGYLLPVMSGPGRFQILGKTGRATFSGGIRPLDVDYDQTTTEFNVNYILKGSDARVMLFYLDTRFSAVRPDSRRIGVAVQLQR